MPTDRRSGKLLRLASLPVSSPKRPLSLAAISSVSSGSPSGAPSPRPRQAKAGRGVKAGPGAEERERPLFGTDTAFARGAAEPCVSAHRVAVGAGKQGPLGGPALAPAGRVVLLGDGMQKGVDGALGPVQRPAPRSRVGRAAL